MTRIKRSIPQRDGTVLVKALRGPFRTESISAALRPIVVELHPTHLALREHGCRQRLRLDFTKLMLWASREEAERKRREKRHRRTRGNALDAGPTPRRAVRRGVLNH